MPYLYPGLCLAAMFGSIIYEHQRIKKEERRLRDTIKNLAKQYPELSGTSKNSSEFISF